MASWLSDEWLDRLAGAVADRPPAPGVTGLVDIVVTSGTGTGRGQKTGAGRQRSGAGRAQRSGAGGAQNEVRVRVAYKDGQPSWAPSDQDADVTFTIPAQEAQAILVGEQEPSVGFMRGRIKTSGPPGLVLAWLASTATPGWAAWRETVRAFTDFPSVSS